MRTNKEVLKDITKNKAGINISRNLFHKYTTQPQVTKEVYPKPHNQVRRKKYKKNFVLPHVNKRFQEWNNLGFIRKSKPQKQKVFRNGKYHQQTFKKSIMNLEPIFIYASIEKNVIFTPEEKEELERLFSGNAKIKYYNPSTHKTTFEEVPKLRERIIDYCPRDNVISSFLKFYTFYIIHGRKGKLGTINWFHIYKMGKPELWESIEIKILKTLGISN